jgi:alpha-tubulin suppressor-like RCC1 family protein
MLADDGTVFSFGSNSEGQTGLGIEGFTNTRVATPIDTTNLAGKTITQVAAGDRLSLLLADDGTVFSFGSNRFSQLGLGTNISRTAFATPIDMTNLAGLRVIGISAGDSHSLLLAVPVPEPGGMALFLLASLPLLIVSRGSFHCRRSPRSQPCCSAAQAEEATNA